MKMNRNAGARRAATVLDAVDEFKDALERKYVQELSDGIAGEKKAVAETICMLLDVAGSYTGLYQNLDQADARRQKKTKKSGKKETK